MVVPIKIFDNNEWQPDLEFFVELYDGPCKGEFDTITKVTIIDEDFPGSLGFEDTQITV